VADGKQEQPLDIDELLKDLAHKIERVKVLYEQYFMGIEKIEPLTPRKDVQRNMLMLQQQYIRNTGLRFRFNTMLQKWNIYVTYWNRTLREIENGTYVRHVIRAQRAAVKKGVELPEELKRASHARPPSGTFPTGEPPPVHDTLPPAVTSAEPIAAAGAVPLRNFLDVESAEVSVAKLAPPPASPPPPARRASPPPPPIPPRAPAAIPGMSESDLRALHRKFSEARLKTGEGGEVSYDALVKSLNRQLGSVLAQPGVSGVRFDVAVQNGKTVLKAIPQKK
jgi:hypothetical protein